MSLPSVPCRTKDRKRGLAAPAILLGAAVFTLTGCKKDQGEMVESVVYSDAESCRKAAEWGDGWILVEECNAAWRKARSEHQKAAPRYDSKDLCQEQHGGACERRYSETGAAIFVPAMAGFMIGNMWRGNEKGFAAQPVYGSKQEPEQLITPQGERVLKQFSKTVNTAVKAFQEHKSDAAPKVQTRASVTARNGFGSSRTSSRSSGGSSRSFGG